MIDHGKPPNGSPKRVAVVHNDDFKKDENPAGSDEPPSQEANAEVALTAGKIASILKDLGHETMVLGVTDSLDGLMSNLDRLRVDAVFNLVESLDNDPGREPDLPKRLESMNIPYTGNSPAPLLLSHAKDWVKQILSAHHIPTAPGFIVQDLSEIPKMKNRKLPFPLFVKPARTDASIGIDQDSIVYDRKSLNIRVSWLLEHGLSPVLVEEYLPGSEVNVAIFPDPFTGAVAMTHVDFSAYPESLAPIVTYNCKWMENSPEYLAFSSPCLELFPKSLQTEIFRMARAAFLVLGGNSYGRVDLRLNAKGRANVIDVNPNPDLDPEAGFAIAAHSIGVDYSTLIRLLVDGAATKENYVSSPYSTKRSRSLSCITAAY